VVLTGPEGGRAEAFFAGQSTALAFPVKASFSGVLLPYLRDAVPFVAGISAASADEDPTLRLAFDYRASDGPREIRVIGRRRIVRSEIKHGVSGTADFTGQPLLQLETCMV
jgi:hypothetical protein